MRVNWCKQWLHEMERGLSKGEAMGKESAEIQIEGILAVNGQ
jgi:hypothetical protein